MEAGELELAGQLSHHQMEKWKGPNLEVGEELPKCHLFTTGLQALDLQPIPQRPLLATILEGKEQEKAHRTHPRTLLRLSLSSGLISGGHILQPSYAKAPCHPASNALSA